VARAGSLFTIGFFRDLPAPPDPEIGPKTGRFSSSAARFRSKKENVLGRLDKLRKVYYEENTLAGIGGDEAPQTWIGRGKRPLRSAIRKSALTGVSR
jgi:hypothetical protein